MTNNNYNNYQPPENPPIAQQISENPNRFPANPKFSTYPVDTICRYCEYPITTQVRYITGTVTWLVCIILICFGCILGCCLIPFHADSLKDAEHKCPHCNRVLHVYDRIKGH